MTGCSLGAFDCEIPFTCFSKNLQDKDKGKNKTLLHIVLNYVGVCVHAYVCRNSEY